MCQRLGERHALQVWAAHSQRLKRLTHLLAGGRRVHVSTRPKSGAPGG
jgi:hypothetical protein